MVSPRCSIQSAFSSRNAFSSSINTNTDAQCVPCTCHLAIFSSERLERQSKSSFSPWPVICILYGQLVCHILLLKTKHILLYRSEGIDKHWWVTSLRLNDNRCQQWAETYLCLNHRHHHRNIPFSSQSTYQIYKDIEIMQGFPTCTLNKLHLQFKHERIYLTF